MSNTTTIKVSVDVRDKLIRLKSHPRATYNEVIERLILGSDESEGELNVK